MLYDGIYAIHGGYTLNYTGRNMRGDPLTYLLDMWLLAGDALRRGRISPFFSDAVNRRIPYQTRIWRLILDETRTFVTKIAATHAAMPTAAPTGAALNYNSNAPFTEENASVNAPFECTGLTYNDPSLVEQFNRLNVTFNPGMHDLIRENHYRKIPVGEAMLLNYRSYLRINPRTMELEYWVAYDDYYKAFGEDRGGE